MDLGFLEQDNVLSKEKLLLSKQIEETLDELYDENVPYGDFVSGKSKPGNSIVNRLIQPQNIILIT